jgi:HK97 family phage portal protein
MNLLNRFGIYTRRDIDALKARIAQAPHLLATARQEEYTIPDTYGLYRSQAELFRRLPALSTAVEMLSNVGALVKASVMQRLAGEESQDVPNHPFEVLLANPNPLQSGIEFIQDTIGFRTLAGNGYWWLNRAGPNAPPDEMWVIQPDQILPAPDENMYLRGYLFDPGTGVKIPLETWEVVHFKRFNPFSRFVGLSVIEALAITAVGDIESNRWNTQLFGENNARLPGILAFADPINDVDWERLKREARDKAAKRELMMLRGVGAGGVQWMQASATQREMEFLEGREFSKREVWDAIAPGLSSMLDPSATEASSKTGRDVFNDYAVYPIMQTMASKINSKGGVMQSYGSQFFVEFEDIRSRDRAIELQEQAEYAKTHTVDEIRKEKYGDKAIGDERGKLFPVQVNAQSGGIQSDPKIDVQREQMAMEKEQPKEPMMDDEQPDAQKAAYLAELNRWQRKALKHIGKATPWDCDAIPPSAAKAITDGLPGCKSEDDVRALFARYEKPEQPANDLQSLALLLETAIKAAMTIEA